MIEQTARRPLNLHEYEAVAQSLLSPAAFAFVAGGAADAVTLRGNRAAFDRWRLLPRVLRGLREVSTATTRHPKRRANPTAERASRLPTSSTVSSGRGLSVANRS